MRKTRISFLNVKNWLNLVICLISCLSILLLLSFPFLLCGCVDAPLTVDTPGESPDSVSGSYTEDLTTPRSPKDTTTTVTPQTIFEASIAVTDSQNAPVSDLCVELERIAPKIEGTSYTLPFPWTNKNGYSTDRLQEGTYCVTVSDREGSTVFETMTTELTIRPEQPVYTITWEKESPAVRREKAKNQSVIFSLSVNGAPLQDAFVAMYEGHAEEDHYYEYEPLGMPRMVCYEQTELGYTDQSGQLIWTCPKSGDYTIYSYIPSENGQTKVTQKITVGQTSGIMALSLESKS